MPLISVIIPVYNRTTETERAVSSVLQQQFEDFEIIIVNDGSTDNTASLLQQIARNDSRIKIISLESNYGVSCARNQGIAAAQGKYIALLDSDDSWHPHKLTKQVNFFSQNPDAKICHTDEIWIRNGVRVNQMKKHTKPSGDIFLACLPLCVVSPSSVLIERSIFDIEGLFDEELPACEDYDLWLRLATKYQFYLLAEPLVIKYGGHQDQLSRKFWGMDRFRLIALIKLCGNRELTQERMNATYAMITRKATILAKGFQKRDKIFQCNIYTELAKLYSKQTTTI